MACWLFVDCLANSCLIYRRSGTGSFSLPQTTMLGGYLALGAAAVIMLLPLAAAQPTPWRESTCASSGTYAANSTYQTNLGLLAAALPANVSTTTAGFATATVGVVPDLISALALCRGDTNASTCHACVAAGFPGAQRDCPYSKDVTIYQDDCVLRFSDQRFLDLVGVNSPVSVSSGDTENLTVSATWFNAAAVALMNATVNHAVTTPAGNSTKKFFATGEENFDATHYPKLYGLAQCVPEMTAAQCQSCLSGFIASMSWFLNGNPRGRLLGIWCNLRYSVNPFYSGSAMVKVLAPPAPAPATVPSIATAEEGTGRKWRVAGISAAAACFAILVLILAVFAFIRLKRRNANKHENAFKKLARGKCTIYDFPMLQEATGNFSEQHKLGEGGFGTVYKGNLPGGQEIAVKKLIDGTGQGLDQIRNEVLVLAQLQHKNLVRLQGFCLHQNEMLLVYEYIKNGSLDNFLFEDSSRRNTLNWDEEYNIILGIAKGIMYLHEDSSIRIIHRDLKANNILLDDAMDPKIADFGLARLQVGGHTQTKTTRVVGTFGYMAPEYAIHGNVSPKIDIFSFGVLALEIVTKRRNCSYNNCDTDTVNLLSDVWTCWTKGTVSEMIDQSLEGHSRIQALRCIHIGLLCVQSDPDDRPDIPSIIFMLNREDMELQPPAQPAFFFGEDSNPASPPCQQGIYVYNRSEVIFQDISVNGLTVTYPYPR